LVAYTKEKKTWVHDIEIYRNYLLIGFKSVDTGKVVSWEVVGSKGCLSDDDIDEIREFMRKYRTVGFNTRHFDLPILYSALSGLRVIDLKKIADDIILGGRKSWDIERDYGIEVPLRLDHIDLIEVAPGKASLKIYNGRLHGKRMQDLPIDPDAVLTDEEIEVVYDYWKNDLDATILLYNKLKEQLDLRASMSTEYRQDLRSKSDAQIAEAVIRSEVGKLLGEKPKRPEIPPGTRYSYIVPDFIRFKHPDLRDILAEIERSSFRVDKTGKIIMPRALADANIKIGNGIYRMGIGGLHSSEKCQAIVAREDQILVDRDVTSYYPMIILRLGLYPKHMGKAFLKVYREIVNRRLKAKAEGNTVVANSLKITINGSFGKFGSPWSALYSPDLLIRTTITGQLSLLMFIERLERAGIRVVSANTDGIVMLCDRKHEHVMREVVEEWEHDTGFGTEATEYSALYSRDVNNYIAVKKGGGVKLKGAYAKAGFMKNPQNEICIDAVIAHITEGKSLSATIRECRDITKFVTVRQVQGGAICGAEKYYRDRYGKRGQLLKPEEILDFSNAQYLGKAIRWYYSTNGEIGIFYKTPNRYGTHNLVPRTEGAKPLMELPDKFPDDVDYGWYIREARSILQEIGFEESLI